VQPDPGISNHPREVLLAAIVAESPVAADRIASLLLDEHDLAARRFADAAELLQLVGRRYQAVSGCPDIVLLDTPRPGGVDVPSRSAAAYPGIVVAVVAMTEGELRAWSITRVHADGGAARATIRAAIERARRRGAGWGASPPEP
jgi:hypothetical protein